MVDQGTTAEVPEDERPGYGWTASEEGISFYFVVFLSLLATTLVLCKFLHDRPKVAAVMPEAGLTIIVGVVAGYFVQLVAPVTEVVDNDDAGGAEDDDDAVVDSVADGLLSFSPTVFFVALLPPIIFNSGYHLKREIFFRHAKPIVLFACLGTAVSTLVVAVLLQVVTTAGLTGSFHPSFAELLTFGALISATDPVSTLAVFQAKKVDPQLFYLVFGESVLNDAVGLVLFNALAKFVGHEHSFEKVTVAILRFAIDFSVVSFGSLCLGFLSGILAALLLKTFDMRQTGLLELCLYVLVMYLPFFFAEILHLSGIVTILCTGISAKRYAEPNLSHSTDRESDVLFRVTAHLAETAIFLELGLSVFGLASRGNYHTSFIFWSLLTCLIGRAANIYPITLFFNRSLWRNPERDKDEMNRNNQNGPTRVRLDESGGAHERISLESMRSTLSRTRSCERDLKIGANTAHMLWFSGLRGAVAYACAKTFPNGNGNRTAFIITTMVIVLITVYLLGGTTEIALSILDIDMDVDEEEYMRDQGSVLKGGLVRTFEEKYICPWVIREYGAVAIESNVSPRNETTLANCHQPSSSMTDSSTALSSPGQVEMTEMTGDAYRKKKSLYDYGSRRPSPW